MIELNHESSLRQEWKELKNEIEKLEKNLTRAKDRLQLVNDHIAIYNFFTPDEEYDYNPPPVILYLQHDGFIADEFCCQEDIIQQINRLGFKGPHGYYLITLENNILKFKELIPKVSVK